MPNSESNSIKNHQKIAEEYLDALELTEKQKNAVKDTSQYKAYTFGLSPELASKFDNPFQALALTELKLSPEQALLVKSPVTFNDIKENNLTHSQIEIILAQEQFRGNVKVSERLKFAEENNLDTDLILLLQYPAQFKAIAELNLTIAEAIKFGNGEAKENEINYRNKDLSKFFDTVIEAAACNDQPLGCGKVYAWQLESAISANHFRSAFEFEIFKAHQIPGIKCNYSDAHRLYESSQGSKTLKSDYFFELDELKKEVDVFSNKYGKTADLINSLTFLIKEYNEKVGIIYPNVTTYQELCDAKDNNQTFKDSLLELKEFPTLNSLDFYSPEFSSFCETKSSEFIFV